MGEYRLPTSAEMTRPSALRFLARPWQERRFTYARYDALLARLAEPGRFHVVPLRDLEHAPRDRPVVALRHDVDDRLPSAVRFAELEHARGLPASYYVLHTAPYYGVTGQGSAEHDPAILPVLRRMQDELGHEIGFHHDLVTLARVHGIDPGSYLAGELAWLRGAGLAITGCAAHGSYWAHRQGFHNDYAFRGWDAPRDGHPLTDIGWKLDPAAFGLEYDASHLGHERYATDSRFDAHGRRWHPDELDLDELRPGERLIILIHSCHWDSGVVTKALRQYKRTLQAVAEQRRRSRLASAAAPGPAAP